MTQKTPEDTAKLLLGYVAGAMAGHLKDNAEPDWRFLEKSFKEFIEQERKASAAKIEKLKLVLSKCVDALNWEKYRCGNLQEPFSSVLKRATMELQDLEKEV